MADNKKGVKKLSPSWVEAIDPTSGRVYYANIITKQTSWVRPDDEIKKELEEKGASRSSKKGGKKKDVWLERQDPATGRVYYYNPAKRETSWYRPDETISSGALQADEGKGAWVERQDPRTGRTYYYNPVLGKTSWTNPDAEEEEANKSKNKKDEGALKRLSTSIGAAAGAAAKRVSTGLNRLSFGSSGLQRASARYSLSTPAMPVNRNSARASLRLGADVNLAGAASMEEAFQEHDSDRFAKLRAMKNQGAMPQQSKKTEVDYEAALRIDLAALAEEVHWDFDLRDFSLYAQENFNLKQKGMFSGKALSAQQLRTYQKKQLVQPLHELNDKNLVADALYSFKTLLQYCGDKSSRKPPEYHAKLFLSFGNGTAPELQREIYSQLIKQTTNNPEQLSEERTWELMALCCGTFVPPPEIILYVKSHLKQAADTPPSSTVKRLAEYSMLRLTKIEGLGPRLEVPCEKEIMATRAVAPYNIRINLVSSTAINIQVESWTTVAELKSNLAYRFQIKDASPFAIYEVNDEDNERVLFDEDRILDLIAFWEREIETRSTKKFTPEFQFVYKIRLFFDISEDDTAAIELAYLQAVYEVLDSRYPCSEDDCIRLAALEAQEKFGDFNGSDVFQDQLGAYLPSKFYGEDREEDLKRRIYTYYKDFQGYDKLLCMVNYLDYVKKWKYYGSAYYFANPITLKLLGKEFPKQVIIGVNAKGILIIDPESLDLISEYPYSELVTWGHSAKNFVLVVGNLVRSQKIFFNTKDGVEMNSLIHAYVNKLMEAQPQGEQGQMPQSGDFTGMVGGYEY